MKRTAPLVRANYRAREDALVLLPPGVVLEVEVARAICEGRAVFRPEPHVLGAGWVAHFRRAPGMLRRRPRAWLITSLLKTPDHNKEENDGTAEIG